MIRAVALIAVAVALREVFFLEKNLIGVKFIASILDVRRDNEEICSIL